MSDPKSRRIYTAEEKMELLRRHLVEKVAVSDLCNENGLAPSAFYGWQQQLFARGHLAFESSAKGKKVNPLESKVAALESKLAKKDHVIAEISGDYVQLKKELGVL